MLFIKKLDRVSNYETVQKLQSFVGNKKKQALEHLGGAGGSDLGEKISPPFCITTDTQKLKNTKINLKGKDLPFIKSYVPMFFGNNKNEEYNLSIKIEEEQIKRSVEKNQATSILRYELRFIYILESKTNKCVTYEKEILSSFSIIPKSSGYKYGSDISLESKYELAVSENLNRFVSLLSGLDLNNCI